MKRLDESGVLDAVTAARLFPDVDRAIEAAEDDLLNEELKTGESGSELALADLGLLAGLEPAEVAMLAAHLTRATFERGREVFREGDPGLELMMIASGAASAYLGSPGGNIRLATFGPGTVFGEMALLDEGTRAATVVADGPLVCYSLSRSDFTALGARAPTVAIKLLANLSREMTTRLRTANRTIHQLEG
jgi:CRP-like cAMP-binding protein